MSETASRTIPPPQESLGPLQNLRHDIPASVVVFLVALPLCLGIAVASGAPPLAGLISGAVGGLVVGALSGSPLAVSGPAAGLTTIVLAAIASLGYEGFLLAVFLGGLIQIALGLARAGIFAYYFPSSVIKGMLAAIGLILILKQLPHAFGFDQDFEGDLTLLQQGQLPPFKALSFALGHIQPVAAAIAFLGLVILIVWERVDALKKLKWLPAPLVVVWLGIGINALVEQIAPGLILQGEHLVALPEGGLAELRAEMSFPDFSRIGERSIWVSAFTIAAVASIETLLCIEAIDKLDPFKRRTPTNRELLAQGVGNSVAGLLGGMPLTAVIVRGSANVQAGGRTKLSTIVHGLALVIAVLLLAGLMNLIPLAALAAILLHVGYKLANPALFRQMFRRSREVWVPFVVTVAAILLTDLLRGVGLGMAVGVFFLLRENLATAFFLHRREEHEDESYPHIRIELSEHVSFLNKAAVSKMLQGLPKESFVEISGKDSQYIHPDVVEIIREFDSVAHTRGITVELLDIPDGAASAAH